MVNRYTAHNQAGEPEVIDGKAFAKVLKEWIEKWYKERPKRGSEKSEGKNGFARPEEQFYSPYFWLEDHTGINNRKLRGIAAGEFRFVSLTHADKILTAIERTDLLDDELKVIQSPYWSPERWAAYMSERGCY